MAERSPVSLALRPELALLQSRRDTHAAQLSLPIELPPLCERPLQQIQLNMSMPDSMFDPRAYQRQYRGGEGSTFYASELRADPETYEDVETGYGSIIIAGDIGSTNMSGTAGTSHIGYTYNEASYVSATFLDRQRLREHYEAMYEGRQGNVADLTAMHEFSGPFVESYQPPLPTFSYVGARREGDEIVVERRIVTEGQEEVDIFRAPFRINGLPQMLRDEGRRQLASDNDAEIAAAFPSEGRGEQVVFEVPKRYPASFSSVVHELF